MPVQGIKFVKIFFFFKFVTGRGSMVAKRSMVSTVNACKTSFSMHYQESSEVYHTTDFSTVNACKTSFPMHYQESSEVYHTTDFSTVNACKTSFPMHYQESSEVYHTTDFLYQLHFINVPATPVCGKVPAPGNGREWYSLYYIKINSTAAPIR